MVPTRSMDTVATMNVTITISGEGAAWASGRPGRPGQGLGGLGKEIGDAMKIGEAMGIEAESLNRSFEPNLNLPEYSHI